MRVADVMTPRPASVEPGTSLNGAMDLMDRLKVRHLPVMDDGRLAGIVSQRDLLSATGWLPLPAEAPDGARVSDVMHSPVATISPDDSVVSAALELELRRIGCMPVTDGDEVVGILSEVDLLRVFRSHVQDEDPPVSELMTPMPEVVAVGATVADAEARCERLGIRHLPVVSEETCVGIVSDRDLRRHHGRRQPAEMPVEKIMTPTPLLVEDDCPASVAAHHMITHGLGALPVVTDERIVGIVTVPDLLEHCQNHLREDEQSA